MDKFQAIQAFWESFELDAYDENTVPTGSFMPELPYITYEASTSDFNNSISLHASLWYYGSSWEPISKKLSEIESYIGRGGIMLPVDGGAIWIVKEKPFAQRMSDKNDMIRRIFMRISAEFITAD